MLLYRKRNLFTVPITLWFQEPPLYESNFVMALVYIVLMVTALVIGTAGNLLILVASACLKSLRKTGYIFIGEAWFNDKPWLCETVAAMCLTACFCAFLSLTLASMNRYVFVCHNMIYDRIFTKNACIVMCVTAWLLAFFFEFPNFIGIGDHTFDKKSHQCIWDRTASFAYTLIVSVVLIGGPLVSMGLCYLLIFRKIYSTKFNLYQINTEDPSRMKKIWSETVKSCRMLFVIFLIFVALWTPYAVVIAMDVKVSCLIHW
ncbi:melatonin receptor type 1A [Elysia marginata]|uniref:Melatonin receptor type 1A n=1 Tax=Elysia marginata TaxID=1093978 RepID=A0AAV4G4G8_9GAST|nr:melatonin receptor type 1A [Elysia marginata]